MSFLRSFVRRLRLPICPLNSMRRINLGSLRKQPGALLLLSSTVIHTIGKHDFTKDTTPDEMDDYEIANKQLDDFNSLIKQACEMTEQKIKELIKLLNGSIQKSCEEYRKLIEKQMEIIKNAPKDSPLSPYWDELVKNRVLADNLKQDILKFQSLVDYVEKLILNLHICQTLMDQVDKNIPALEKDFQTLKALREEQLNLNKKVEQELLKLNALDILKSK